MQIFVGSVYLSDKQMPSFNYEDVRTLCSTKFMRFITRLFRGQQRDNFACESMIFEVWRIDFCSVLRVIKYEFRAIIRCLWWSWCGADENKDCNMMKQTVSNIIHLLFKSTHNYDNAQLPIKFLIKFNLYNIWCVIVTINQKNTNLFW